MTTTITINEFKMWLEGVEEMQDAEWTPNPTQWKRIREKFNTIGDTPPVQQSANWSGGGQVPPPGFAVMPPDQLYGGIPSGPIPRGIPPSPASVNPLFATVDRGQHPGTAKSDAGPYESTFV